MLTGIAVFHVTSTAEFTRIKAGVASRVYGFDAPVTTDDVGMANFIIEQLLEGVPRRMYFCVSNEHGDSNEVSRVITLRRRDRPRPPQIQAFDLTLTGSDDTQPDVEFIFEVSQ